MRRQPDLEPRFCSAAGESGLAGVSTLNSGLGWPKL